MIIISIKEVKINFINTLRFLKLSLTGHQNFLTKHFVSEQIRVMLGKEIESFIKIFCILRANIQVIFDQNMLARGFFFS